MPAVVLLILVVIVVVLILKAVGDAQRQRSGSEQRRPPRAEPQRPARPAPRRLSPPTPPAPEIDKEHLDAHVEKLRSAVEEGLISREEAIGSILRFTGGQLSEDAAQQALGRRRRAS